MIDTSLIHHDACRLGQTIPRMDCKQCEILDIIDMMHWRFKTLQKSNDDLMASVRRLQSELDRLERAYANGL